LDRKIRAVAFERLLMDCSRSIEISQGGKRSALPVPGWADRCAPPGPRMETAAPPPALPGAGPTLQQLRFRAMGYRAGPAAVARISSCYTDEKSRSGSASRTPEQHGGDKGAAWWKATGGPGRRPGPTPLTAGCMVIFEAVPHAPWGAPTRMKMVGVGIAIGDRIDIGFEPRLRSRSRCRYRHPMNVESISDSNSCG